MKKVLVFIVSPILLIVLVGVVLFINQNKVVSLSTEQLSSYSTNEPQNITDFKTMQILDSVTQEKVAQYKVSIADDDMERMLGLMFVKELPVDQGMFFIFPQDDNSGFWMKNCEIPLDLIFIDANYKIVGITQNAQPCKTSSCEVYNPAGVYRYVLEVNGGESERLGVRVGDGIRVESAETFSVKKT